MSCVLRNNIYAKFSLRVSYYQIAKVYFLNKAPFFSYMYNTTFFARKSKNPKTGEEKFSDIFSHINSVKMSGPNPYYKILLRESIHSESPQYFGWKDYQKQEYSMIFPWEGTVRMCFPYGPEVEEKRGLGKLVGFILEDFKEFK